MLSKAKEGGESIWASALTIHNELLRRDRKVHLSFSEIEVNLTHRSQSQARTTIFLASGSRMFNQAISRQFPTADLIGQALQDLLEALLEQNYWMVRALSQAGAYHFQLLLLLISIAGG